VARRKASGSRRGIGAQGARRGDLLGWRIDAEAKPNVATKQALPFHPLADQTDAQRVAETDTETYYAPPGALTWRSNAERNKLLIGWRLAVCIAFAEHPRCLRVALGALDHLFNTKTGFCYASNTHLAKLTGLPISKVQEALAKLEDDGAIRRLITDAAPGRQRWRAIYPATSILAVLGERVTPTVGATRNPHLVGVQNLRRKGPRLPKSELERARLAAKLRQDNAHRDHSPTDRLSEGEHDAPPVIQPPPSKQKH
jgi:hypothetical protein